MLTRACAGCMAGGPGRAPRRRPAVLELGVERESIIQCACGPLAQLAEQLTLNQQVTGSTPVRLTKRGEVSELVDEHDLGSCAARRRSSSLLFPTTLRIARSAKVMRSSAHPQA